MNRTTSTALAALLLSLGLGSPATQADAAPAAQTAAQSSASDTTVYRVVDRQPEFPGGYTALKKFVEKNLRFPKEARDKTGRVMTTFVIEKDGSVSHVTVTSSPDKALSREAVRVLSSMPRWTPGSRNGAPARVEFVYPILFRAPK